MSTKTLLCAVCHERHPHPVAVSRDGYDVTRCDGCGVGRTQVDSFRPEDYYTDGYFKGQFAEAYVDYEGSEPAIRREFRHILELVRRAGPAQGRLLELGCAYGYFLQEAKSAYDVHGVEMAPGPAESCRQAGLSNVHTGGLTDEIMEAVGAVDVVVMLDVIEHIDDVDEVVARFAERLNPGGLVLVTTGDWNSLVARWMGARWRLLTPPMHLWYFAPASLDRLFARHGLERIHLRHPIKIVPLNLILQQGLPMLRIKPPRHFPEWMARVGAPATLFDAMRVMYRKQG